MATFKAMDYQVPLRIGKQFVHGRPAFTQAQFLHRPLQLHRQHEGGIFQQSGPSVLEFHSTHYYSAIFAHQPNISDAYSTQPYCPFKFKKSLQTLCIYKLVRERERYMIMRMGGGGVTPIDSAVTTATAGQSFDQQALTVNCSLWSGFYR